MTEQKLRSISEVEEVVNEFAAEYGKKVWGLPPHAVRVILWPNSKNKVVITRGTTALIRLGSIDWSNMGPVLKAAIDHVAKHKMYDSLAIERLADILRREEDGRRFRRVRYNFDEDLVPHMLPASEVIVRYVTRVEAIHRVTGKREVIEEEIEHGRRALSVFTIAEIAKARLARAVHAAHMETNPMDLPADDPNWIARTN